MVESLSNTAAVSVWEQWELSISATSPEILASAGHRFRTCRIRIDAAQRDVAEGARITHTTLGTIEEGLAPNANHFHKVRRALMKIAIAKARNILDGLELLI